MSDPRQAFLARRRKQRSQGREVIFASKPESIAGTEVESVVCLIDSYVSTIWINDVLCQG